MPATKTNYDLGDASYLSSIMPRKFLAFLATAWMLGKWQGGGLGSGGSLILFTAS